MQTARTGILLRARAALGLAAVLGLMMLTVGRTNAQLSQRLISDFVSQQGSTVNWWPPVPDYLGWTAPRGNIFALVDYAGVANAWLKANGGPDLGTLITGTIIEEALTDGRAEVTVTMTTTGALSFASAIDPWGTLWFGHLAPEVVGGATPAIGSSYLQLVFKNTAVGAPLPNIVEAMVLGIKPAGFEMKSLAFMSDAVGPLRVEAGMGPEGTGGRCTVAQLATFTPANQDGVWLVESIPLEITAPRGRLYIWVAPRNVRQGTANYLRAYVRSLPTYTWMPKLPVSFVLDGSSLGWETTDAGGQASSLYQVPAAWALGAHTLVCGFAGDALYQPTSNSAAITCIP